MFNTEEYIKKVVSEELVTNQELVKFLTIKIKNDPATVKKLLLSKFLYRENLPFQVLHKDISELKILIYKNFMEEIKKLIA